ncbi:glycosyltransferase [Yoonia sediminilitoris]|uniref:glycosyltransferase n=1 Tax=Yoonia sediminilitoris TaxID=1286148 RepID=UPI001454F2EE|nr:glycosyltransferase [Yoonia sediminilitoris]
MIDDTTAGGVMRVIDHVVTSPELAKEATHVMRQVARGKVAFKGFDADVIVSHLSISWRTLPALLALRLFHPQTKLIHVEHSYTRAFMEYNVAKERRFKSLLRLGFGLFDRIVAVSDGQRQWMRDDALVADHKLSLVRSYTDLGAFLKLPAASGDLRHFGAIGRLDRQKGFDLLIEAFRKSNNANLRLTIFGEGEEETSLRALAQGDPRIHFAGMASNPVEAYRKVDAVIMPSRWEAYGLVAIETISAGRTLFCSAVDGLADHRCIGAQVTDGRTLDFDQLSARPAAERCSDETNRNAIVSSLRLENTEAWKKLIAA